jgi:DNA topoisomerase-1
LTPEEEEVATMYAITRQHENYTDETFKKNFFKSWKEILGEKVKFLMLNL